MPTDAWGQIAIEDTVEEHGCLKACGEHGCLKARGLKRLHP